VTSRGALSGVTERSRRRERTRGGEKSKPFDAAVSFLPLWGNSRLGSKKYQPAFQAEEDKKKKPQFKLSKKRS